MLRGMNWLSTRVIRAATRMARTRTMGVDFFLSNAGARNAIAVTSFVSPTVERS